MTRRLRGEAEARFSTGGCPFHDQKKKAEIALDRFGAFRERDGIPIRL